MTRTSKFWLAAFVLVVFSSGALSAVLADRLWLRRGSSATDAMPPLGPRGGRAGLSSAEVAEANVRRLDRELHFTAEQRERVLAILERRDERIRELQQQARQQFVSEQQALQDELAAVLTAEQRDQLSRMRGRLLGPAGGRGPFDRGGRPGDADGRGFRRGRE